MSCCADRPRAGTQQVARSRPGAKRPISISLAGCWPCCSASHRAAGPTRRSRRWIPSSAHCLPTTKAGPESASALYGQNSLRQGGIWTPAIADCNCSRAVCSCINATFCNELPSSTCSQSSDGARSSTTSNRVSASSDSTRTLPPCASMIDLTMASPSPAPSPLRCRDGSPR